MRGPAHDGHKPNTNPAPGQYEPSLHFTRPKSKVYGMCKTPRQTLETKGAHSPSPSAYTVVKPFGHNARKITIAARHQKTQTSITPSPCDYDPSVKLVKPRTGGGKIHQDKWVLIDEAAMMQQIIEQREEKLRGAA